MEYLYLKIEKAKSYFSFISSICKCKDFILCLGIFFYTFTFM